MNRGGLRGFTGHSLCKVLSQLGLTAVATKRAIRSVCEAAGKATKWLWIKRLTAAGTQTGVCSTLAGSHGESV